MSCPVCNENLLMSERHGVEIDYCPKCRGIWLDRGELDKLLSLSEQHSQSRTKEFESEAPPSPRDHGHRDDSDDRHHRRPQRKRESWLGDILDF